MAPCCNTVPARTKEIIVGEIEWNEQRFKMFAVNVLDRGERNLTMPSEAWGKYRCAGRSAGALGRNGVSAAPAVVPLSLIFYSIPPTYQSLEKANEVLELIAPARSTVRGESPSGAACKSVTPVPQGDRTARCDKPSRHPRAPTGKPQARCSGHSPTRPPIGGDLQVEG